MDAFRAERRRMAHLADLDATVRVEGEPVRRHETDGFGAGHVAHLARDRESRTHISRSVCRVERDVDQFQGQEQGRPPPLGSASRPEGPAFVDTTLETLLDIVTLML